MKLLCSLGIVILFAGCSIKEEVKIDIPKKIQDISHISQDISLYSANFTDKNIKIDQNKFEKQYFSAWDINKSNYNIESLQWAFKAFKYGKMYGENLQLIQKDFFTKVQKNANYKNYGKINKYALSLAELNIRAFPSDKPLLLNPKLAGEGFPFDYLQNSTIHANKPLFITHYSKDKEWAHVFSSFTFGWVKTKDIVTLQPYQVKLWKEAQQVYVVKDGIAIYDKKGNFLFKTKLGMLFALISEEKNNFTVLAVASYKFNEPLFLEVKISKEVAHKGILTFNQTNIKNELHEVLQSNYGWGGIYGQRDCSSTLRDFYAPFGIWLPRNSYQQSKVGEVLSLKGLTPIEKKKAIKNYAKPFETLLYKKGHIMLYTGIVDNKITILQNIWGVKTKENGIEGRYIVGKTIFSTLELGSELYNYDKNNSVIEKLQSINTLVD